MSNKMIDIDNKDNVLIIEFINSDKLNPLDVETGKELLSILERTQNDTSVRVVIITGRGKAFSAGGDVSGMQKSIEEGAPDLFMDNLTSVLYKIGLRLREYPKPVIAAVNGLAIGAGMNLALCCDLVIASESAKFSQSFCRVGLIPGFGGTHLLVNQLTWQKAAELAFLGDMVGAEEMKDIGLVNRVVEHEKLMDEALAVAGRLAEGPALVYERTKRLFLEAQGTGFKEHLKNERLMQVESARTEDYATGVKSIIEKKKPVFR